MTSRSYVCCGRGRGRTSAAKSVGRGRHYLGHKIAAALGGGNGSQVFPASMLTVLWLISLTVELAV